MRISYRVLRISYRVLRKRKSHVKREKRGPPAVWVLFDGYALGEVAGFVDVVASEDGGVIGEQLEGKDG